MLARAAALLALAALPIQDGPAAAPPTAQPERGELAAEVEAIRAQHGLPALAGALIDAEGRIVLAGVAGTTEAGGDVPVALDSPWHLGSCLKAMTATLAAIAVEKDLLTWETSPADLFADSVESIDPAWRAVTLEQLLAHRAGAPSAAADRFFWLRLVGHDGPADAALGELVTWAIERPTVREPGTAYEYSNEGYAIAGAMVAAVGGKPYEQLMQEWLFAPLGVESAGFGAPTAPSDPRGHRAGARALVAMPPGRLADNPPAIAPAGTAHMTLADWARVVGLHLRRGAAEGDPLGPEAFESLHRARGDSYALGWITTERGWSEGPVLTHSGSNTFWFCVVWAAPHEGFAALVCTNSAQPPAPAACDQLASLLIQRQSERSESR